MLFFVVASSLFSHVEKISQLTLEEKIGQLIVTCFYGEEINEDARVLVEDLHVGGIIYYNWANGLATKQSVECLSSSLQQSALQMKKAIPLFIAIDQEGGKVSRLQFEEAKVPSAKDVASYYSVDAAYDLYLQMAKTLNKLGVNLNLAPVVDLACEFSAIGTRSFSSNPKQVSVYGKVFVDAMQRANVLACLKHFPGIGSAKMDSHLSLPVIERQFVESNDNLLPFSELKNVDMIMTSHVIDPLMDSVFCTTLSKKSLSYLRSNLGFKGVIISDSLLMWGGLSQVSSLEVAAENAFLAGCDLLLIGGQFLHSTKESYSVALVKKIHQHLLNAVLDGRILESQIDESLKRIFSLKEKL